MRSRLLILLSLIVLLIQPITLLHGLAHASGQLSHRNSLAISADKGQISTIDAAASADDAVCLQCLALNALDAGLPTVEPMVLGLSLQQATPAVAIALPHGGTAAGYHARGPPARL